jgi:hypothetical protein
MILEVNVHFAGSKGKYCAGKFCKETLLFGNSTIAPVQYVKPEGHILVAT